MTEFEKYKKFAKLCVDNNNKFNAEEKELIKVLID